MEIEGLLNNLDFDSFIKLGALAVAYLVAKYIKPISDSMAIMTLTMDKMSDEVSKLDKTVKNLNTDVKVLITKNEYSEERIKDLNTEVKNLRSRMHDHGNKLEEINLNRMRIEKLEGE
jgi:predicted RNase H-like nuclease (RuvC/YqgF family)